MRTRTAWISFGCVAIAAIVAGCTVVVEEPSPGPQFCTREYAPVCATRAGERRTFPNACEARRAGFFEMRRGECRVAERPQFCTFEYAPVCARRGGVLRTFGNACEANVAGYQVIDQGPC